MIPTSPSPPTAGTRRTTGVALVLAMPAGRRITVAALLLATVSVVSVATVHAPGLAWAFPLGLAAVAGVLAFPFGGLLGVVFAAQMGGVIEFVAARYADFLLEAVAFLVILGIAVQSWREPRRERWGPDSLALRLALLFALALFLSFLFADNRAAALVGLKKRLNLLVLFYLIVRMADTLGRVRALLLVIVISTAVSSIIGVLGYALGWQMPGADEAVAGAGETLGRQRGAASASPSTAAHMMLAGSCIATILALRSRKGRWFLAACAVAGLAGIVVSFSRGTAVAAGAVCGWLLLKLRHGRRFLQATALVLVLLPWALVLVPSSYWQRLSTLGDPERDSTLVRRLGYHLIGAELLLSHPMLGVGPDNFRIEYTNPEYRWMPGRTFTTRALHNMYLSVAVETGLLGFACFATLLVVALGGLLDSSRHSPSPGARILGEAICFACVPYFVLCLGLPAETSKYTWVLMGLAVALSRTARRPG